MRETVSEGPPSPYVRFLEYLRNGLLPSPGTGAKNEYELNEGTVNPKPVRGDRPMPSSNQGRDLRWLESMWDIEVQESKQALQERVEATSDVMRFLLEMDRADAAKELVRFEQQRSLR